ncbi:DNA-binding protein [Terfezia boudieri ATCC MYA-4762]|uniref:DNA-binding protein n=1 Tax=Terfezia boudieri ATCC MYA-4762 TaxID=1051890 RepID=A0A3N4LK95_9PEZI|nr:DNA-binding protein [Terfezia boudieri ATCC MYA-4762]
MQRQAQLIRPHMKPVQATKEVEAAKQGIKQDESLEIVKTLLGASFGCLSFLRGLLPEESFEEVRYGGPDCPLTSYNWFANSEEPESNRTSVKDAAQGTRMKRLKRGYSSEADQLLNWLEQGIFEALRRGYLKAVQLAIYVDPAQPDVITEAYTFSFAYRMGPDGTPDAPTGFNVKDNQGNEITVAETSKNIQQVMRRMIVITQNLPTIPDTRYLTVRLHYMDWTPDNYSPPYFRRIQPEDPRLRFREDKGDSVLHKILCGSVATGHHGVSLKVAAFHEPDDSQGPKKRPRILPANLEEDIEMPSLSGTPAGDSSQGCTPIENPFPQPNSQQTPRTHQVKDSSTPGTVEKVRSAREQIEAKMLRKMLDSPKHPAMAKGKLVETQHDLSSSQVSSQQSMVAIKSGSPLPSRYQAARTSDRSPLATRQRQDNLLYVAKLASPTPRPTREQSKRPSRTLKEPNISAQLSKLQQARKDQQSLRQEQPETRANMDKLKLSKHKAVELQRVKDMKFQTREQERLKNGQLGLEEELVLCECGDRDEDGDMIACELCCGWLHVHCYGYHHTHDTRIPDFVVCYTCLLTNEQNLLEEMKFIALFRRALKKVWEDGYPANTKKLSDIIGCDLPSATEVFKRLEHEGFIYALSNKARKKAANAPMKYIVAKTEENKRKMDVEYFDPLAKISHHFDLSQLPPPPQETSPLQTQGADGETTGDEDEPSIKDPRLWKFSSTYSKGAAKGGGISTVPVSKDDEMDLDSPPPRSEAFLQTPGAQKRQGMEPSPWRRYVGICEEGVYFPSVF